MLGTSGRRVSAESFPEELRADVSILLDTALDYEDAFLRSASMFFSYHNSGKMPATIDTSMLLGKCAPEILSYMADSAASLLIYLYDNGFNYFLRYGLWYFAHRRMILPTHFLPRFVELAYTSQSKYMHQYRLAVWPLLGNRGKWLVDAMSLGGEKFADASHQLRLRMFVAMRKAGIVSSSRQLAAIWNDISTSQRKDFLSVFMRVGNGDLDFLWEVFLRGGIEGTEALRLMCRNPQSRIVEYYMQILDQSLRIDGRRHCDFSPITDRQKLAEYGIDSKVSATDNLPDFLSKLPEDEVIIFKLIQHVPLQFWMRKLDCDAAAAARFLSVNPAFRMGFDFRRVISMFQDAEWATEYSLLGGKLCSDFLPFMDSAQLERVADGCDLDGDFRISEKIFGLMDSYEPWLQDFSSAIVRHIIHTRNFENTVATAQFLAVRLSRQCDIIMESYVADSLGNDIVVSFFQRLIKYRRMLRQII